MIKIKKNTFQRDFDSFTNLKREHREIIETYPYFVTNKKREFFVNFYHEEAKGTTSQKTADERYIVGFFWDIAEIVFEDEEPKIKFIYTKDATEWFLEDAIKDVCNEYYTRK